MTHPRTPPASARSRRIATAALLAFALHAAFVAMLLHGAPPRGIGTPPARVTLRLIAPPTPPLPAVRPAAAPLPARTARILARPAPPRARAHDEPTPGGETSPSAAGAITAAAPAAEPAASAPPRDPSLLDSDATRRAIRQSARMPSTGEQLARVRDEPARVGTNERLANGIRDGGHGDCAKGDYAGAGMGLLSLPFLAYAAAAGHCAK